MCVCVCVCGVCVVCVHMVCVRGRRDRVSVSGASFAQSVLQIFSSVYTQQEHLFSQNIFSNG